MTDALSKLDEIYGVVFDGKTYDIGNRIDWLKTSIEFALKSDEREELIEYMKNYFYPIKTFGCRLYLQIIRICCLTFLFF